MNKATKIYVRCLVNQNEEIHIEQKKRTYKFKIIKLREGQLFDYKDVMSTIKRKV